MNRKPRSPLHGATRNDIAALRALIVAHLRWEADLGTPQQQLHPNEPVNALASLSFGTVARLHERSYSRWARMPHYEESRAVWRDQHLYRYDRAAWEQKKLRDEVTTLRAEVAEIAATPTAPPVAAENMPDTNVVAAAREYHERHNGRGSFDTVPDHVRTSLIFRMSAALRAAGVNVEHRGAAT